MRLKSHTAKYIVLILIMSLTALISAQAQYVSRLGRFKVDEVKGCAPFTVTITDTNLITTGECTAGKPCLMNPGDGSTSQQNQFTITYTQPGTYKLSVLYQSIGADDISITVDANIQPAFEIYTCAGLKTSIKITDKGYDQYYIDFNNDGVVEVAIPNANNQTATHTYPAAGNYNISVKGKDINAANNCTAKVQAFAALATLPVPQVTTLTAVDDATLKLDFNPQANMQYKLEIASNNATTFQQYQTLYGVSTANMPNLKVDDNYYCFRLGSYDPCANANTYAIPICSQNFDLSIVSGVNKLAWSTASTNISSTEVLRNETNYKSLSGAPGSFDDSNITCKTNYCYQVVSVYNNNAKSISLKKCGDAFITSNPSAISNTTSEVTSTGVKLAWKQVPLFTASLYSVLKSENNGAFTVYDQTKSATYDDLSYITESKSCYKINYVDACDNISQEGLLVCPMRLTASVDSKNAVTLRWSKLKGLKNGVKNYRIQRFDKAGTPLNIINAGTDTVFVDDQFDAANQQVQYQILADANEAGLSVSKSNVVSVLKSTNLFYPTAFTPDKTGPVENEKFNVSGQYIDKMELKIFDRWGNLVFYSDKDEAWDGTNNGRTMPEGTYVWIANITDKAGQSYTENGTIVILRKVK